MERARAVSEREVASGEGGTEGDSGESRVSGSGDARECRHGENVLQEGPRSSWSDCPEDMMSSKEECGEIRVTKCVASEKKGVEKEGKQLGEKGVAVSEIRECDIGVKSDQGFRVLRTEEVDGSSSEEESDVSQVKKCQANVKEGEKKGQQTNEEIGHGNIDLKGSEQDYGGGDSYEDSEKSEDKFKTVELKVFKEVITLFDSAGENPLMKKDSGSSLSTMTTFLNEENEEWYSDEEVRGFDVQGFEAGTDAEFGQPDPLESLETECFGDFDVEVRHKVEILKPLDTEPSVGKHFLFCDKSDSRSDNNVFVLDTHQNTTTKSNIPSESGYSNNILGGEFGYIDGNIRTRNVECKNEINECSNYSDDDGIDTISKLSNIGEECRILGEDFDKSLITSGLQEDVNICINATINQLEEANRNDLVDVAAVGVDVLVTQNRSTDVDQFNPPKKQCVEGFHENILNKEIDKIKYEELCIPLTDPLPKRRLSIFVKKHESDGSSRSPSPVPKRYSKLSGQKLHPQEVSRQKELLKASNTDEEQPRELELSSQKTTFTFGLIEPAKGESPALPTQKSVPADDEEGLAFVTFLRPWASLRRSKMWRSISGGSTSEDELPEVRKSQSVDVDVKGKKLKYFPLLSKQRASSESCDEDEYGYNPKDEKSQTDEIENEHLFVNSVLVGKYPLFKRRSTLTSSFKSCFGIQRKRTVSDSARKRTTSLGSDVDLPEVFSTYRAKSKSKDIVKLHRYNLNEDVNKLFKHLHLPLKKQRTFSVGEEVLRSYRAPHKSQRSRSSGEIGEVAPVVVRAPSVFAEPWKGAWRGTTLRIVEPTDTLASVAAHFDITPSELAILNRLPSRTVFPGQVIRVPDKRRKEPNEADGGRGGASDSEADKENKRDNPEAAPDHQRPTDDEMDMLEKLRLTSPKPGHAERVRAPLSPGPASATHQRFLKINVRHITDGQGVVSGVLLVTSNAVMFDPNVSDPLVIEHGPESYGVIAPMEYVVNVAIYHDIAHMRVGSHDQFRPDWPKPEVYYLKETYPPSRDGTECDGEGSGEGSGGTLLTTNQGDSMDSGDPHHSPSAREDSLLAKDETFPELRSSTEDEEEDNASLCSSSVPREGDAFPKAFDRDLVTPTNLGSPAPSTATPADTRAHETNTEVPTPKLEGIAMIRSLEERRKSSLDHHWAVPSKVRSLEEHSASVPESQEMANNRRNSEGLLVKLSCHDSGIDIRDPPPHVVPVVPRKAAYSDADVLLGDDFVPPVPIVPLRAPAKKTSSVSFSLEEGEGSEEGGSVVPLRDRDMDEKETKKNKMLKRLSYPLSWMEGLSGDKEEKEASLPSSAESAHPASSHSSSSVFSKVFSSSPINMVTDFGSGLFMKTPSEEGGRFPFPPDPPPTPASAPADSKPQGLASFSPSNIITSVGRSSVGTFIRQQHSTGKDKSGPKLDYRSMVSVEDMPELFVSFDKLIPRPAQSCDDPPLYLRLRMGKPKDKKIPKSTPIMSYGKKKMRPEYWFSVPRERVDDLYRFLTAWVPHLYGDLNETVVADRGYELVDSDTELWENEDAGRGGADGRRGSDDDDIADLTRESWEVSGDTCWCFGGENVY